MPVFQRYNRAFLSYISGTFQCFILVVTSHAFGFPKVLTFLLLQHTFHLEPESNLGITKIFLKMTLTCETIIL